MAISCSLLLSPVGTGGMKAVGLSCTGKSRRLVLLFGRSRRTVVVVGVSVTWLPTAVERYFEGCRILAATSKLALNSCSIMA